MTARLVPELYCSHFDRTLQFYAEVLGFTVLYARPEERFAYLEREGADPPDAIRRPAIAVTP